MTDTGPDHPVRMPIAAYVRIFTGEDGHSYFEDVRPEGHAGGTGESDLRAVFSRAQAVDTAVFRHVLDEADDSSRHNAPRSQFIVMLRGECEVETSRGETRRLGPGDVILADDLDGHGHVTRRVGDEERLTMVITLDGDR